MHVLVFASDHLGIRILEQLQRDGCRVSVAAPVGSWLARADLPYGLKVVEVDRARPTNRAAEVAAGVDAIVAATDEDELNLGAVLIALEANPKLRVVLRQFNLRLGRLLAEQLPQCETLSVSALSAPTFALAALTPGVLYAHAFGEDTLVLREAEPGTEGVVIARDGDRVLVATSTDRLPGRPSPDAPSEERHRVHRSSNRLLRYTLAYLGIAAAISTVYFRLRLGLGPVDAIYFVVTIVTSVGFGDFNLRDADVLSKVVGMWLMISGVMSMAVIFAVVTNRLFARQSAFERGQVRTRLREHVVVCGLGVVGFRVAQTLRRLGCGVVVVEANEDGRFVADARADGIHVVVGDAGSDGTLRYANAGAAKAIVVCTNPDYKNLEIALHARSMFGWVPVVLRLFNPEMSRRVSSHFGLDATFSSADIAATRFAAAATGSTRLAVLRFREQEVELHRVPGEHGETVGACRLRSGRTLVAVVDSDGRLRFGAEDGDVLAPDDSIVVA